LMRFFLVPSSFVALKIPPLTFTPPNEVCRGFLRLFSPTAPSTARVFYSTPLSGSFSSVNRKSFSPQRVYPPIDSPGVFLNLFFFPGQVPKAQEFHLRFFLCFSSSCYPYTISPSTGSPPFSSCPKKAPFPSFSMFHFLVSFLF